MLSLEYRPLRSLIPYAKNARVHPRAQIQKLKGSLAHYGWANPMLVADNGMIAGHGRLAAALEMAEAGIPIPRNDDPWTGPVVDLSHLSREDRAAYVIQDNRSALDGMWDEEILAEELGWLQETGFELTLTGFEEEEMARILGGTAPGGKDIDDAPSPPVHPVTRTGDVWMLGKHRLICGDATDPEAVHKLLAGVKPHLCVTDPPYGTDYDPSWRLTKRKADGSLLSTGKDRALGAVVNDDHADWSAAWKLFDGDVMYVWHSDMKSSEVHASLENSGFEVRNQIIWAKSALVVSRGHYHHQHEACWYAVRKNKTAHWSGGTKRSTLWEIEKTAKSDSGHSTQKPADCMMFPILNNSNPGQCIYDPFVGSGTTILACEAQNRICFAIDIHPPYVDMALKRWQTYTDQDAVLEATGMTFDQMSVERPIAE